MMASIRWRWFGAIGWFIALSLRGAVVCPAEEIPLGTGPSDPVAAGFTMAVLGERLGNEGFQPITLRFRSLGQPFNRQRRLRVLFRPRNQYATKIDFQFSSDVIIPEGIKTYDADLLVPHFYRWESCSVHLSEAGRSVGKAPTQLAIPAVCKDWGQHVSIGIVVPRDAATSGQRWAKFPDVRGLVTALGSGPIPEDADVTRQTDKDARDYVKQLQAGWARFRILDEQALEKSWLGYSQLDVILVPYPVLQRIETEQPQRMRELKRWLSTGTEIWTYAASDERSGWLSRSLPNEELASNYPADPKALLRLSETNDGSPVQYQPWNYGSYYAGGYSVAGSSRKSAFEKLKRAKHPLTRTQTSKQLFSGIDAVRYGLGRVVLISDEDPFPGSFQLWHSLNSRLEWSTRQGVNYSAGNDSYWLWLMATVGMPPVTAFVVLNGLFVLVMGPILYFGLRRRGRLYLLYFAAPTLALLATLSLFTYAFVSDGFTNRGRVRDLIWFDGRHAPSQAGGTIRVPIVRQSRQTFYTVVDSGYGLRYDDDALVLPVFHSELMNRYSYRSANHDRPGDYRIDQYADRRIYGGDFLPTRTQVHQLVTRPSIGDAPVTVRFADDGVTLTNHLGTPLTVAAVRDADGDFWTADRIPADATVAMQKSRVNPFGGVIDELVNPPPSDLPSPYKSRFNSGDRTGMEEWLARLARNPERGSFCARTPVVGDGLPLRDCVLEDSWRLIGGYLP